MLWPAGSITGCVLAGGRGLRMGGLDKGLQLWHGTPLAQHALQRLQQQAGGLIGPCLISANRNLTSYQALGVSVWPDALPDFAGPLAGFLTGLQHCSTDYLLTVPCDSPRFPLNLARRLAAALQAQQADLVMAQAPNSEGDLQTQPVFALMHTRVLPGLLEFTRTGGRKITAWGAQQRTAWVPFNTAGDDPLAFGNLNTLAELAAL